MNKFQLHKIKSGKTIKIEQINLEDVVNTFCDIIGCDFDSIEFKFNEIYNVNVRLGLNDELDCEQVMWSKA